MRGFIDEIRSAISGLARAPAFTALAVSVLALGLGAVIFMYGVADTMMLKPAPYPNGDRLYTIITRDAHTTDDYDDSMAPQDYLLIRDAQTQFEAIGAGYTGTAYLTGDGQAERYDGSFVDGYLFDVAGVAPELGRTILPRDATEGAAPVVVLSQELWRERFDADPAVVGRMVRVNGRSSEVIGVMPERFNFPSDVKLWVPIQQDPARVSRSDASSVTVYARMKPDGNADLAMQEFSPVAARVKAEMPAGIWNGRFELMPFQASFIGDDQNLIWTMLVAVGFVLLIACANVSNLLLARSAYRVRETTVRSALGASRGRLVTHILAEGLVISMAATVVALLLASIALDAMRIVMQQTQDTQPAWWVYEIDFRVVAFAVAAALLSTIIAGLPAAFRASRPALDSLLRDGGRTGTGLAIGKITWGLVVFEVALACLLLGVSTLMAKSALKATGTDVGVETADIMTARVGLTAGTYVTDEEQIRFWDNFLTRLQAQPGVEAATVATALPGIGSGDGPVSIEGRDYGDVSKRPFANGVAASNSYFETFRLKAVAGRLPDSRDTADSVPVAVINETMAKEMWPDSSPIGARVRFDTKEDETWFTVIGVIPDLVHDNDGKVDPTMYKTTSQSPERFMSIAVRGDGDPRALIGAVRTALAQTDPDLALYWLRTLDEFRAIVTSGFRIIGSMFAIFAGIALVLGAAGLYGVLAFHVGQRTREIGVRRALGADNRRILKLVMRASGVQVLLGIAIGMALLPFMARAMGDILGESIFDSGIYGGVVLVMLAVAVAATLMPTRRALRIDPAVALRYE